MLDIDIKEEGRAGLLYAKDANGKTIEAEDGITGVLYFCPECGCQVHHVQTQKGNHLFARNPGEQHTSSVCITYEQLKVKHAFYEDPLKFIRSLCYVTPREKHEGGGRNGTTGNNVKGSTTTLSMPHFRSLAQISKEIAILDGSTTKNGHPIHDYVLTYKNASEVFRHGSALGARIVLCRFKYDDRRNQALIFELFTRDLSVKFRLVFPKRQDFLSYRDKFLERYEADDGTTKYRKKNDVQDVLIACDDWELLPRSSCRGICFSKTCDNCIGMYQCIFTNPKQIYLI